MYVCVGLDVNGANSMTIVTCNPA